MKKSTANAPDVENPEWTEEAIKNALPFSALPNSIQNVISKNRRRGPQKAPKKVPVSIRLSPDVANGLRATGGGWQNRADEVLRLWLEMREI
jgi:uncharacterized protein (DUF4415 family)